MDTVLELTDSVMNVARDLINHGVDVNSVDNLGLTPVHLAAARMPSRVLATDKTWRTDRQPRQDGKNSITS